MDKFGISEVVTNLATCERADPPTASNWFPANLLRQMDTSQADIDDGLQARRPVAVLSQTLMAVCRPADPSLYLADP